MSGRRRTRTPRFGTGRREAHDASGFYGRRLYGGAGLPELAVAGWQAPARGEVSVLYRPVEEWANRIYCHTAEQMLHIPDGAVALAFTSPPYNAGKEFDADLGLLDYFGLIGRVATEVYRVLKPGGRYLVNVANLGRRPYIPLHAYFYAVHMAAGFLPAGEIVWWKGRGMSGSCAWGSWRSARSPVLRDVHEYILVLVKERLSRPDRGESTISAGEFLEATVSVWDIPPASARAVGHPAPFPVELAERAIKLYSYAGDVVLDPFCGSGSTCVAAARTGRLYVGYDVEPAYCRLAERRVREEGVHQRRLPLSGGEPGEEV